MRAEIMRRGGQNEASARSTTEFQRVRSGMIIRQEARHAMRLPSIDGNAGGCGSSQAARHAQTTPARVSFITVAGDGHARRAGLCGILRRSRHARRQPRSRDPEARRAGGEAAATLRGSQSTRPDRRAIVVPPRAEPCAGRLPPKKQAAPEYRAITTFALKANQIGSLNEVVSAIAGRRRVRSEQRSATASRTRSASSTTRGARR